MPGPATRADHLSTGGLDEIVPGIVFEDSPKGAEAARNAGMDCIVITTLHRKEEFATYKNVIGFIKNFHDALPKQLICVKEKLN